MSKIKNITIVLFLCYFAMPNSVKYKLNAEQNKRLNQAKSLRKSGLIEETKYVYFNLLEDYPYMREALNPLKEILRDQNNLETLNKIALKYQEANNNSFLSKVETFEIFLWTNNKQEWGKVLHQIKEDPEKSNKNIDKVLSLLLNNNKLNETIDMIDFLRKKKGPDYFSLQLGMYYSISSSIEKSIHEFLLYLKYNPKKKTTIRNRIMALPDITGLNNKIKDILNNSNLVEAKLIVADMEFKQKNYGKSYSILDKYSTDDNDKIEFTKNLIKLKEYDLAQNIINDILSTNTDKKILKRAIIQLAFIFENLVASDIYNMPITNDIVKNQLINSKYIKVNQDNSHLLTKAIGIYDSLRIYSPDNESVYRLAEIKYRILGDLDGAEILYNQIINSKNTKRFKLEASNRVIDILISKGMLDEALLVISDLLSNNQSDEFYTPLNMKKMQLLFYLNKFDQLKLEASTLLKEDIKNHKYYNDLLKIMANLNLFYQEENALEQYSLAMHKLYQNKRTESLKILEILMTNANSQIADKITFESAYLQLLQGEVQKSIEIVSSINQDSPYEESALILEAEIYDYILYDKSKAVEIYLLFLDMFPDSIHYDTIRLRLRSLAS